MRQQDNLAEDPLSTRMALFGPSAFSSVRAATGALMRSKIHGLETLRAYAILSVLLFHYQYFFAHPAWLETGFFKFGWSGVDLFFVLSGYLITSQLLAEMDARKTVSLERFYIKRAFRILPPFGFVLALYVLLPWTREKESLPPLWKLLTFTQNLGLDVANHRTFSHAWSLCIEEQCYLSHKIVFHVAQEWLGRPAVPTNGPVMMLLCLASAFGFALLMHLAIERPALRLRDRLLARRSLGS